MSAMSEAAGPLEVGAGGAIKERAVVIAEDDSMAESLFQITWIVVTRGGTGAKFGSIP